MMLALVFLLLQSVPSWAAAPSQSEDAFEAPIAQREIPGCGPSGNQPPKCDPPNVPIDGGLALLGLAGVGFGVRKLRGRS